MHDRTVTLGDIPARVMSDSDIGAIALGRLVGALPTSSGTPRCTIRVGPGAPRLPEREADASFPERRVWASDDTVWLQDASGVTARVGPGEAWLGFEGLEREVAIAGIRQAFLAAAGHVLAFDDRFLVHAGAVSVGDRTVLVLGDSGSGKSTLGLAAHQAGWSVLSDDLVILRRTCAGEIEAAGVPRPPMVPTDLGAELGPEARDMPHDPRRRAELPAGMLVGGFHRVEAVVVCGHADGPDVETSVVSGADILFLLVGSFPPAAHPGHVRRAHPLFTAVARLPRVRLAHGSEPSRRLAGAVDALGAFSRQLDDR
jgi:hypothetical protein